MHTVETRACRWTGCSLNRLWDGGGCLIGQVLVVVFFTRSRLSQSQLSGEVREQDILAGQRKSTHTQDKKHENMSPQKKVFLLMQKCHSVTIKCSWLKNEKNLFRSIWQKLFPQLFLPPPTKSIDRLGRASLAVLKLSFQFAFYIGGWKDGWARFEGMKCFPNALLN